MHLATSRKNTLAQITSRALSAFFAALFLTSYAYQLAFAEAFRIYGMSSEAQSSTEVFSEKSWPSIVRVTFDVICVTKLLEGVVVNYHRPHVIGAVKGLHARLAIDPAFVV